MSKRVAYLTLALLLIVSSVKSQETHNDSRQEDLAAYADFFDQATDFSLSFLRFEPRSYDQRWTELRVNGVSMTDLQTGLVPWGALGSTLSSNQQRYSARGAFVGWRAGASGGIAGGQYLWISPLDERAGGKATAAFSNRTYTYRLQGTYNIQSPNQWAVTADVSRRWGRSLTTDGVFADVGAVVLAAAKNIDSSHAVQITLLFAPNQRASSTPATREAFELAADYLYNPSWGFYGVKERSARVRTAIEPMVIVNHEWSVKDELTLRSALFVRAGRSTQSSLTWQGAPNPLPDYWAAMPSAQTTPQAQSELRRAWSENIETRQIDFRQMQTINHNAGGRAKYAIQSAVRDLVQASLQSTISGRNFMGGVALRAAVSRKYKVMDDLLSGRYWVDVDSFLEQDDDTKDFTINNLRNPNAKVGLGDEFGYNYTMGTFAADLWGAYRYSIRGWDLSAAASLTPKIDQRTGRYEKQNFQSGRSWGASESIITLDAMVKATAEYNRLSRLSFGMSVAYARMNPHSERLFISPLYRNAASPVNSPSNLFALEARVAYNAPRIKAAGSLYCTISGEGTSLWNLYDDIRHAYVHYAMSGIRNTNLGIEASAEITIAPSLYGNIALALQSNRYTSNPVADEYKESTGEQIISGSQVLYDGLHVGGSPEMVAVAQIDYRPYGWMVSLTGNLFGGAYALPSPLRRTYDALRMAASPQAMVEMQHQERLADGFTLDLFVGRTWYLYSSTRSIGIYAGVNNIFNNCRIASVGYESSRLRNMGSSYSPALVPHASKYYYALGVNYFVNLTFRF